MKKFTLSILLVFTSAIAAMANGHTVGIQLYDNVQCFGMANGSATVTVSGGFGPFTYSWMPSGGTDSIATGLSAGTYTVTVTDQSDLSTASTSVIITAPSSILTSSASATPSTICFGDVTTLNCNASGGVPAYNYQWESGTGISSNFICGPLASPTVSRTYTLTVTDMNGCSVTTSVNITVNGMGASITGSTTICNGSSTLLTATGGGTYSWSTGETTAVISVAPSNTTTYTVTVTNGSCAFTASSIVVVNTTPPIINVSNDATICSDASITLVASGAATYTWSPSIGLNNPTGSSPVAYPSTTTTYTVIGTIGGCTGSSSVVITVKPAAIDNYPTSENICEGSFKVLTASGNAPIFTWLPANGLSATTGTSVTASPTVSTTYTVSGSFGGCLNTFSFYVGVIPIPKPIISGLTTICGSGNTELTATTNNAYGGLNYQWSTGETSNSIIVAPSATTTYSLTASYTFYGCPGYASVVVNIGGAAISGIVVSDSIYKETCIDSGDGAIDISLSGSNSGPFTYQWSNGKSTQDITNLSSNNYTLIIFDPSMNCLSKIYQVAVNGSNCGSISGNVFNDKDLNCIKGNYDPGISNTMIIASPGNYTTFTDSQGYYIMNNIPYGTYALTQQISNPNIFQTCTPIQNTVVNTTNKNIVNLNFSDTTIRHKDVSVNAWSRGIIPGFICSVTYYLNNLTFIPSNGTLCITLPSGYGSLISSGNPSGYNVNGDTICWTYTNLIYSSLSYTVFFSVPPGTLLGSLFQSCATATVIGTDVNPANNYYCYSRIVTGSFDPNDKSVNPIGEGPQGNITLADNTLDYHINFQNTGNGPAVNIMVKDTLSDKLDINTLEITGASHNYIIDVMDGNVLRWKFNNIMLADSGSNEPASHGWIDYRIKQKTSNQIGDEIKNTAHIYFDFNEAVVTNTTINTIATPIGVKEITNTNNRIKVYPNPFSDNTTFVIQSKNLNEFYSFELFDVLGKQVRSITGITTKEFQISRSGLENGIYFYKIYAAESVVGIGKLTIK